MIQTLAKMEFVTVSSHGSVGTLKVHGASKNEIWLMLLDMMNCSLDQSHFGSVLPNPLANTSCGFFAKILTQAHRKHLYMPDD